MAFSQNAVLTVQWARKAFVWLLEKCAVLEYLKLLQTCLKQESLNTFTELIKQELVYRYRQKRPTGERHGAP